jgi:hypothetical protein
MAIRLLSLMMVVSAAASSGAAAMSKVHQICAGSTMGPVLQALDARGIAYKRTILMAAAAPTAKSDEQPA